MDPMVIDLMRYRGAMRVAKVAQQPALLSRRDTFVSAVCQGVGAACPVLVSTWCIKRVWLPISFNRLPAATEY